MLAYSVHISDQPVPVLFTSAPQFLNSLYTEVPHPSGKMEGGRLSERLEQATILDKIVDGKFVPHSPPESRIGKWCVLALGRLHL